MQEDEKYFLPINPDKILNRNFACSVAISPLLTGKHQNFEYIKQIYLKFNNLKLVEIEKKPVCKKKKNISKELFQNNVLLIKTSLQKLSALLFQFSFFILNPLFTSKVYRPIICSLLKINYSACIINRFDLDFYQQLFCRMAF